MLAIDPAYLLLAVTGLLLVVLAIVAPNAPRHFRGYQPEAQSKQPRLPGPGECPISGVIPPPRIEHVVIWR